MSALRFRLFLSAPAVGKSADEPRERVAVWQRVKMRSYHE
jgi:hypothetical protein